MIDKNQILEIHNNPKKLVLAITGGGTGAIDNLLKFGGGSNTLLEAVVPYHQKSLEEFVKGTPDKFCSADTALDLAMAAYQRAISLTNLEEANNGNLIGIGATCSLAKDEERQGRRHTAYIAVQTKNTSTFFELDFTGKNFNRVQEEELVADAIVNALENVCNTNSKQILPNLKVEKEDTLGLFSILTGQEKIKSIDKNEVKPYEKEERKLIFPGSFNPIHDGHINMAREAAKIMHRKVNLEICVHNVDKPALNYINLKNRIEAIQPKLDSDIFGEIHLTALPTFMEKALFFPEAIFIVGWDTFVRICDPKYAKMEEVLSTFKEQDIKFIVFHRIVEGKNSLEEKDFLSTVDSYFEEKSLILDYFEASDLSSSKLRQLQQQ